MLSDQSIELLKTKLTPPRLPESLVWRDDLLAHLSAGLNRKLTLVAAPAGSGKTTLMSQWIAALPAGWVALDAGDNDPVRFWRYFISACKPFAPDTGNTALERLKQPQPPAFEVLLTSLVNDLTLVQEKAVLVLEDYHHITAPIIHEAMTFLLDHLPPSIHLVIITRGECPLPLARLRARGELNELTAADLCLTEDNIATFFENTLALELDTNTVTQFAAQTEGWAASLRLASLLLQAQPRPESIAAFLANFTGKHRHIMDYLAQEVLATQPQPIQDFLLQTSYLARLNGALCDAITGRGDSAILLEHLSRANVFITPLDAEGRWYRYHVLFAEAMQTEAQRRFGESAWSTLHQQAIDWYETHGLNAEAVEIALTINDHERAAALIAADGESEPY